MTAAPAPGFLKNPDRRMDYRAAPERVRVYLHGEVIADSERAVALHEADYPVVHYIPREDVRTDLLERDSRSTYCPYKGTALYWTVRIGGQEREGAAWSYDTPYDEAVVIRRHIAFYPSRVDRIEID